MIDNIFEGSRNDSIADGGCFEVCLCRCRDEADFTGDVEDDAVGEYAEGDVLK